MKISEIIIDKLNLSVDSTLVMNQLGMLNTVLPGSLSFIDSIDYIEELEKNENVTTVLVKEELVDALPKRIGKVLSKDPKYDFFSLHNYVSETNGIKIESRISSSGLIDDSSYISHYNVVIEDNVCIGPNVTILENVHIKSHVIVQSGTVIGSNGFEIKRTKKGIISVYHDGGVILEEGVEVGANCSIDKGIYGLNTSIGANTKLDNNIHIAHNAKIGSGCFLVAGCCVLGSVEIGNEVWIGPMATIINTVKIGDGAEIAVGSIVSRDVDKNIKVIGKMGIPKARTY